VTARLPLIGRHSVLNDGRGRTVLIKRSFLHDHVPILFMHHKVEILQRVAVHQKEIGKIAFLDLPQFVAQSHHLSADARAALQSLAGREVQQIDEVTRARPEMLPA
jgi:hypothetical protein